MDWTSDLYSFKYFETNKIYNFFTLYGTKHSKMPPQSQRSRKTPLQTAARERASEKKLLFNANFALFSTLFLAAVPPTLQLISSDHRALLSFHVGAHSLFFELLHFFFNDVFFTSWSFYTKKTEYHLQFYFLLQVNLSCVLTVWKHFEHTYSSKGRWDHGEFVWR